jgi:2-isopropylmalate synthase
VRALVRWTRELVTELGFPATVIDWHGHNDRGVYLITAIPAAHAGADRIHGTVLGIGERVGNTPMDLLMVNMWLLGMRWGADLTAITEYARLGARSTNTPLPFNYPVFGRDAFRTATGVHAAAVIKAMDKGDPWIVDSIYSGVPAHRFGLQQIIEIGHMAGRSNVLCWLQQRGIDTDESLVSTIFKEAKSSNRVLAEDEVYAIIKRWRREQGS